MILLAHLYILSLSSYYFILFFILFLLIYFIFFYFIFPFFWFLFFDFFFLSLFSLVLFPLSTFSLLYLPHTFAHTPTFKTHTPKLLILFYFSFPSLSPLMRLSPFSPWASRTGRHHRPPSLLAPQFSLLWVFLFILGFFWF